MATTISGPATEADLVTMPDDGYKYELDGEDVLRGFRCPLAEIFQ
jgi:hypothetical protein